MEPSYRIFLVRVIELIEENKECSERIGIKNTSHFVMNHDTSSTPSECINSKGYVPPFGNTQKKRQ